MNEARGLGGEQQATQAGPGQSPGGYNIFLIHSLNFK